LAAKAATFGWSDVQLFGCHRDMPWLVVWWGAIRFVNGGEIIDITDDIIRITTSRGTQQSISRMRHDYDFIVPVWDVPASSAASLSP
jgi:hypothetical protein